MRKLDAGKNWKLVFIIVRDMFPIRPASNWVFQKKTFTETNKIVQTFEKQQKQAI